MKILITVMFALLWGMLPMYASSNDVILESAHDEAARKWNICLVNQSEKETLFEDWIFNDWHPDGPINFGVRFDAEDGRSWVGDETRNFGYGYNSRISKSKLYLHFRNVTTLRPREKRSLSIPYDMEIEDFLAHVPQGGIPIQGQFVLSVWVDLLDQSADASGHVITLKKGKTLVGEFRVRGKFAPKYDPPGYEATSNVPLSPNEIFNQSVEATQKSGKQI